MTNTSGAYLSSADPSRRLQLSSAESTSVQLRYIQTAEEPNATSSFRPSKDFFLCKDDGLVGRHGAPEEVYLDYGDRKYVLWVEQRAPTEFGLIPIPAEAQPREYSNRFLGVDESGRLTISDEWGPRERWSIGRSQ